MPQVRHEINILDALLSATTGNSALSDEIASLETTKYASPTYYFEIEGDTSLSLSVGITLRRKGTSTDDATATIPVLTTVYGLFRSTAFTPPAGQTEYQVFIPNTAGATKNVKAARIIIIDSADVLTAAQTQVEIGENVAITSTTTLTALKKLWKYTSANWDGSPLFYAEICYKGASGAGATTTDTAAHSSTFTEPYGVANTIIELWGGGGAGGGNSTGNDGGGGGSGGGYAKKTLAQSAITPGTAYSYVVGAKGTGVAGANGNDGNDSTFTVGASTYKANKGIHGSAPVAGAGGVHGTFSATGQLGDTTNSGGAGGDGRDNATGRGGGGGEGARTNGTGGAGAAGGGGGPGSGGTGGDGGDGGAGGDANAAGSNGTAPGGGGGGSGDTSGGSLAGGNGADGQLKVSWTASGFYAELQEDNGSLAGWTKIASIVDSGNSSGAARARSSAFTPTSGRSYRIACARSDTAISPTSLSGKIIIDQPAVDLGVGSDALLDSQWLTESTGSALGLKTYLSQSFLGNGWFLSRAAFNLALFGSPTGNMLATLYAHTGTYGTSSIPTGSILATSDPININTLSGSFTETTFTFSGANRVVLSSGVKFCIVFSFLNGDASNNIAWTLSALSAHAGNKGSSSDGTSWTPDAASDLTFKVYSSGTSLTKLEEQYLLANATFANGTALQVALSKWDSGEWSGVTNTYNFAVDSDGSSSVVEADTAAGTQLSGSSITCNAIQKISGSVTMPSNGNLDCKATTDSGDMYSARILVQCVVSTIVTYTQTPDGGSSAIGGAFATLHSKVWSPSSGIQCGGSDAILKAKLFAASGGIQTAGTGVHLVNIIHRPDGGSTAVSGVTATLHSKSWAPNSGITVSSQTVFVKEKVFIPSGTVIQSGGTGSHLVEIIHVSSGGVTVGGGTLFLKSKSWIGAAGMSLSGSGILERAKEFIASGGSSSGGTAIFMKEKIWLSNGGAQSGGTGAHFVEVIHLADGGIFIGGSTGLLKVKDWLASGGVSLGGLTLLEHAKEWLAGGGISVGDTAATLHVKVWLSSGGMEVSGEADHSTSAANQYSHTGDGGVSIGGLAALLKIKALVASGGASTSGVAGFSKIKDFDASGGSTASGSAIYLKVKVFGPDGLLVQSGGSADHEFIPGEVSNEFLHFPDGGVSAVSGHADWLKVKVWISDGGVLVGGEAEHSQGELLGVSCVEVEISLNPQFLIDSSVEAIAYRIEEAFIEAGFIISDSIRMNSYRIADRLSRNGYRIATKKTKITC